MRRCKISVIFLLLVFLLFGCLSNQATLTDGSYTGKAQGNNGVITVEMTVQDGKIADLKVIDHSETKGISDPAIEKIPREIVKYQSIAVDSISGATKVSEGIIQAAADCIQQAGGDPEDFRKEITAVNESSETEVLSTDVLVIGGGGSGLQAALRARTQGAEVILIEKNSFLGGATILNGSNIVSTGSELGQEIFGDNGDSQKLLFDDIDKGSHYTIKKELTETLVENIGEALDWVSQEAGLKYQKAQTLVADHSVHRQVELPSSSSAELVETVSAHLKDLGVSILTETRAESLLSDEGSVTGAMAVNSEGQKLQINAGSVIIATGGYGADEQYRTEDMEGLLYYGPVFSTGDGLEMAMEIGADADNLDWYKVYPHGWEIQPGLGKLTTYSSKLATDMGAIYVNSKGERLMDESAVYSQFRDKILEQDDNIAFLVMDKETWDGFYDLLLLHDFSEKQVQSYLEKNGQGTPIVVKADTIEDAAKAAGVDAENLIATVSRYNSYAEAGVDEEFGKAADFLDPIQGGPYYIVEQKDRFATTLGGLIVNPDTMAVKDTEGNEIPNLFAAGEVVGGANGHDSLPSCMNSWNLASAYVAGASAAANIK